MEYEKREDHHLLAKEPAPQAYPNIPYPTPQVIGQQQPPLYHAQPQQYHMPQQQQQQQQQPMFAPPTYNMLPNGQVQMIYTMPPGFMPPQYQSYGQPIPQPAHYLQYPTAQQCTSSPHRGLYVAAMVTYIVGLFTFLPHLISLIMSFVMVSKGLVDGARKPVVLTMAIFELFAWCFCATFSWFYVENCDYYSYGNYCYTEYWGWISIVVWFGVALACGIPRLIFSRPTPSQYAQTC